MTSLAEFDAIPLSIPEMDLESARITRLPGDAFYIPDFVTVEEEERILAKINTAPLPTWKTLPTSHRRLQTYPSSLTASNTLLAAPLPPWLEHPILPRFKELGLFSDSPHARPNHVLVNEYRPGQGIMPHEDGGAYWPLVATVSLGGVGVLDIYPKGHGGLGLDGEDENEDGDGEREDEVQLRKPKYRILQERRSLLVTRDGLYRDYLHGIAEKEKEEDLGPDSICNWELLSDRGLFADGWCMRGTRVSLTYRDVVRVAKVGSALRFWSKS